MYDKIFLFQGHMVVLSTRLTPAGHIILVYDTVPDSILIVNDPWGNGMTLDISKESCECICGFYLLMS
jgi:hypothetical protein